MLTNRFYFILISSAVIASCTSTTPPRKDLIHPDHGLVSYKHEAYKMDKSACEVSVWSKGAVINGERTNDVEAIEKYADRYTSFRASSAINNMMFMGVETDKLEGEWAEAERMVRESKACVDSKGWKRAPKT